MQAEAANATSDRSFVLGALQRAAQSTGADFNYLLDTAMRESGLKPSAKAGTSSASGLFQFVDQTWLGLVKTYGAKYGLSSLAGAISQGADGHFRTSNPADRQAILALRNNPQVASMLEGEFAQATRASMQGSLGRDVCGGELYAAHFLGTGAACHLIRLSENQPNASAAGAFPAAAESNRSVFYHHDGSPKTVREVYNWAISQPNGSRALQPSSAPVAPAVVQAPVVDSAATSPVNTDSLLASFTSWRPSHGFFSSDADAGSDAPSTPFLMTPAVMDVLSTLDPVARGAATN
jgi:hypothetical protein